MLKWILDALVKRYPNDKVSPGLVLAKLPSPDGYYASIARYHRGRSARGWYVDKEIVVNTKGHADPEAALAALVLAWCAQEGITPPIKTIKEEGKKDRFQLLDLV